MTTALVPLYPCAWHRHQPSCACVQSKTQCHCTCKECTIFLLGQSSGCRVLLETAEDLAAAKWGLRRQLHLANLRFKNEDQLVNAQLQVVQPWVVNLPQIASSFEHPSRTPSSWLAKTQCIPQEAEEPRAVTVDCGEENQVSLKSYDKLEKRCALLETNVKFRNENQLMNPQLHIGEPWVVNLPQSASSFEHPSATPLSWPAKRPCIPQEAEEPGTGIRVCTEENPVSLESFDRLENRFAALEQAVLAQKKSFDERLTQVEAQVEQIVGRLANTSDSKSDDSDSSYVKTGTKCRTSIEA